MSKKRHEYELRAIEKAEEQGEEVWQAKWVCVRCGRSRLIAVVGPSPAMSQPCTGDEVAT